MAACSRSAPAPGGFFGAIFGGASANTINPGGVGSVGTLTLGSLATGAGTMLQFDVTNPWSGTPATTGDLLSVTGAALPGQWHHRLGFYSTGAPVEFRRLSADPVLGRDALAPRLARCPRRTAPGLTYCVFDTTSDPGFIDLLVGGALVNVNAGWIPSAAGSFSYNTGANWIGRQPGPRGLAAIRRPLPPVWAPMRRQ